MIKELFHKNWDFNLYEKEGKYYISVMFFDLVDYYRSFELLASELPDEYSLLGPLAEDIRNDSRVYESRELKPAISSIKASE